MTAIIDQIGPLNNRTVLLTFHVYVPNNTTMDDDDIVFTGMIDDLSFGPPDYTYYHLEHTWIGAYALWVTVLTKEGPFD